MSSIVAFNNLKDPRKIIIGDELKIPDVKMVELRPVFEKAGGTITWDNASKTAQAFTANTRVKVKIGSSLAVVNSAKVAMDKPATLRSGRTIVAESFVTGALSMSAGK
jgi:hypothetical protein